MYTFVEHPHCSKGLLSVVTHWSYVSWLSEGAVRGAIPGEVIAH